MSVQREVTLSKPAACNRNPTIMSKPLWEGFSYYEHQVKAVEWMVKQEKDGVTFEDSTIRGGLLADDMGLGKTIELIGLIVENQVPRTLLVVPAPLIGQWCTALKRASLSVYIGENGKWNSLNVGNSEEPAVYIVNYEKTYTSCFQLLVGGHGGFDRIILDEAHRIRNPTSSAGAVCNAVKAAYRWAVTGTPVVNSLKDAVALFRFVGLKRENNTWEKEYDELVPALTLRRSIRDMRSQLVDAPPEPVIHDVVLNFETEEEMTFYRGIQGAVQDTIFNSDSSSSVMLGLLRLRQISVHPQVYIESKKREAAGYSREDWTLPVTKFEGIRRMLTAEANDDGEPHKYIFMCHFKEEIVLLKKFLEEEGLLDKVFTYDGTMDKGSQKLSLGLAKKARGRVGLLMQIHAGGVGLNAQEFDRVVFMSSWWTAALMEQAIARAYRMGQKKVVHVYNFILAEETTTNIDRKIMHSVDVKKRIAEKFFDLCYI